MLSQRWIFTSPGGENEYKKVSVTREHYDAVIEAKAREKSTNISESEQKRRKLETCMWKKMSELALAQIKEQNKQIKATTVNTTYKEFYDKKEFKVRELGSEIDKDLQQKYPLYTDTAKSCYVRIIDKIRAKDPVHRPHSTMFRRDSRFTCRLSDPLDNHVPVEPGHFAYV